jgi:hypothetical protein
LLCVLCRFQKLIVEKDAVFETLVSPALLAAKETEALQLLKENARIAHIHRQLLIRYTAVKFMIDGSFIKLDHRRYQGILNL